MHKLSDSELDVFKAAMKGAKADIIDIEDNFYKSDTLKKDSILHNALVSSKVIFQNLLINPKEIVDFGDFIYKALPLLSDAIKDYVEIEESGLSTAKVKEEQTSILEVLHVLSNRITGYYESYTQEQAEENEISKQIMEKGSIA
ncbi:hypothetical protein OfM1_21080 [Lactovum odontotermitis]